jgi:hypothetical protein
MAMMVDIIVVGVRHRKAGPIYVLPSPARRTPNELARQPNEGGLDIRERNVTKEITRRLNELFSDDALAQEEQRIARQLESVAADWTEEGW